LRDPFEPPLRSGSPRAGFRRRGCEARPGRAHHDCGGFARPAARVLRLPALHLAARARLTRRLDRGARDVSPRAARPPGLSRLETGKDRRLIKTTYSYIRGLSGTPVCTREAPRAAIPAARLLVAQDDRPPVQGRLLTHSGPKGAGRIRSAPHPKTDQLVRR
jgi:hypothetical protein